MAANSKIEWTDATWNPVTGCTPVSAGCENCYAARQAYRLLRMDTWGSRRYHGTIKWENGPKWRGEIRRHEDLLDQPLHWRKPRMVFVVSRGDLFHPDVPFEFIDRVWAIMVACPQHTFQILTKRPARMREYLDGWKKDDGPIISDRMLYALDSLFDDGLISEYCMESVDVYKQGFWPLVNVWLGSSVENQDVMPRVDALLACPAAVRFVSAEPMLSALDLRSSLDRGGPYIGFLDWVICGGESGPGVRPMCVDWARSLRDQCVAAGVPFFFKQHGEWCRGDQLPRDGPVGSTARLLNMPDGDYWRVGKKRAGRKLDGRTWDQMPERQNAAGSASRRRGDSQ